MRPTHLLRGTVLAAVALTASAVMAADISGAGATFPYPIYSKWADAYKKETGNGLNYQSIGSGGGIKQIKAKTVTFGASDAPLMAKELDESGLVQWPMVMGGIVPVVNVEGVKAGELVLDGPTLAGIFMGTIKSWDDAAIKKLNPSAKLPSSAIAVVHRSDGSGTTFNFTDYLSKTSADWKSKIGENTAVEWPVGIGAKGNEGVANYVQQTKGSIGYVEYAYAKQNTLTYTDMTNHDGKKVAPTMDAFQAAAGNAARRNDVCLAKQMRSERRPCATRLEAARLGMHDVALDDVADAHVLVAFEGHAAFLPRDHVLDLVLEALERIDSSPSCTRRSLPRIRDAPCRCAERRHRCT